MDFKEVQVPLRSLDDATLATILPKVTKHPIKNREARKWLRDNDLAGQLGPIGSIVSDDTKPLELRRAVNLFLEYVVDPDETIINSHLQDFGPKVYDTIKALQGLGIVTADHVSDFFDLGGGVPFEGVSLSDITSARTVYDNEVAEAASRKQSIQDIEAILNDAYNTFYEDGNVADLQSALDSAKSTLG